MLNEVKHLEQEGQVGIARQAASHAARRPFAAAQSMAEGMTSSM